MCYARKSTDYHSDEKGLIIQIRNRGNTIRNLYHPGNRVVARMYIGGKRRNKFTFFGYKSAPEKRRNDNIQVSGSQAGNEQANAAYTESACGEVAA